MNIKHISKFYTY